MHGNTSTPWWAGARLLAASALASYARLPLIARPASTQIVQSPGQRSPSRTDTNRIAPATLMSKISAIASTLANVFMAVVEELDRHRRRDRNFRLLSRRQGEPYAASRKLRFLHMPAQPAVSWLPWRAPALGRVRASRLR